MAKLYNVRPSQMLNIQEEYDAYCFDEACAYLTGMESEGKKPNYEIKKENIKKYSSFSDFYKKMG